MAVPRAAKHVKLDRAAVPQRGEDDCLSGNIVEIELAPSSAPSPSGSPGIQTYLRYTLIYSGEGVQCRLFVERGEVSGHIKISLPGGTPDDKIFITRKIDNTNKSEWLLNDDGSIMLSPEIKGSTCQKGDSALAAKRRVYELILPELCCFMQDILHQIHALMSMRDAACATSVSRGFLRSWRFYPNLIFDIETLGINGDHHNIDEITSDFICRIDHIMLNHAGIGVKTFSLKTFPCDNVHPSNLDRWLQVAITPGIKEFELRMSMENKIEYNFPCSLLSTERGSSMQSFSLDECAFHHTVEIGSLSSLTSVHLRSVRISGEELCGFLSKSLALEQLDLFNCSEIVTLKIPSVLLQLNFLQVQDCDMLELIESNAPNLWQFNYRGRPIHISLGDPLQLRRIQMSSSESNMLCCARAKLPSIAPNLQTLFLSSCYEVVNTPMVLGKFIHLKYLDFNQLLLCPIQVEFPVIRHDSIIEYSDCSSLHSRLLPQHSHANLKNVTITGFCSARSMIGLTNHILLNAPFLECLTLDTSRGHERKIQKSTICMLMSDEIVVEVQRARLAIARYVERNVPSTVNLRLIEPCNKCLSYES
ncbi:hypothetical protein PR202_ga14581 [Eleusine coracana subsp. coracana]|uniref:At1g61320/AtMIF1 LRR domain-containing protein n=1 Tax=Eleusine coracana subsp. coracana TaxID=191504 RepID=A0AAV5CI06_ELECO|nr:hypothetical protein PR202_ga14581 [Eleusine coracana subsp. coracana]